MDLGEKIIQRARAAKWTEEDVAVVAGDSGYGKAWRVEAIRLFQLLPEPPSYRRAHDPLRDRAAELLPVAEMLLSRLCKLEKESIPEAGWEAWGRAVEMHIRALAAIAQGAITQGEYLVEEARNEARLAANRNSWVQWEDGRAAAVYDRGTQISRYDSQAAEKLTTRLYCPSEGCRKLLPSSVVPKCSRHQFVCPECKRPFVGCLVKVGGIRAYSTGKAVHYQVQSELLGGGSALLEFDDASGVQLEALEGDWIALLYAGTGSLAAVENLSTGRVLWVVPKGACFVATAVFGENAPELKTFRLFRDAVLMKSKSGIILIKIYYQIGPRMAAWIQTRPRSARIVRVILKIVEQRLSKHFKN